MEIHESVSDPTPTTDSSPKTTFKTAKEHNEDPLLVNTPKASNKSTVATPAVGTSTKKGPTPPLDHNDPVTDGLCLLEDSPPPPPTVSETPNTSVSKEESKINPVTLEIHKLLSVKPLSPAQQALCVQQNTNLTGGSLPEYFDANFCEIDMHNRDFTPMICNAEMEVGNSVDIEISMAEQVDSDEDDDVFGNLDIPNISQLLIPGTSPNVPTTTRTDGGQRLATRPLQINLRTKIYNILKTSTVHVLTR